MKLTTTILASFFYIFYFNRVLHKNDVLLAKMLTQNKSYNNNFHNFIQRANQVKLL